VAHWYVITAIEVSHSFPRKAVVCYGDSITDGRGSTDDKQNRWSDILSKKLYLNDGTINVAVVNEGICATFAR
jgi:lysophospholipase L1-like esterase